MANKISKSYQEKRQKSTTVSEDDDDSVPLLLRLPLEAHAEAEKADEEQKIYYQSQQAPPPIESFDEGSNKTVHVPSISQAKDAYEKKTVRLNLSKLHVLEPGSFHNQTLCTPTNLFFSLLKLAMC